MSIHGDSSSQWFADGAFELARCADQRDRRGWVLMPAVVLRHCGLRAMDWIAPAVLKAEKNGGWPKSRPRPNSERKIPVLTSRVSYFEFYQGSIVSGQRSVSYSLSFKSHL
jgi:hypothetical protein